MKNRYKLTPSGERAGWWVLADTENNIVIRFEEHKFNETQQVSVLDDSTAETKTTSELARIMREMGDYIVRHHGGIAF